MDAAADAPAAPSPVTPEARKTPCVLVIGMAGSGKTTLMQRLNAHLHKKDPVHPPYVVNLDPAVHKLSYEANVDIRDTVNYKEVMRQYGLGPNGAIVTSLNLFATRFDQLLQLLEQRAPAHSYSLIDTPGQIEVFTWSASGQIITEALGSAFPTVVVYVIDTPRCASPTTFMSNMLYACSILYKTRLPCILAFNKTDVMSHQFAVEWMTDYDAFLEAVEGEKSYMGTLVRSMGLVLDEFYQNLRTVGVSAFSGNGVDDFFTAVDAAVDEYYTEFLPIIQRLQAEKAAQEAARQKKAADKLLSDMTAGGHVVLDARKAAAAAGRVDEDDEDDDEDFANDDDDDDDEGEYDDYGIAAHAARRRAGDDDDDDDDDDDE